MDKVIQGFIDNGVLGLIVVGLAWYIFYLHNMYQKSMKDLVDRSDKAQGEWQDIAKDNHDAVKENTGVLQTLKTLIENLRKM